MDWIDNLNVGDYIEYNGFFHTFMGIDDNGLYNLYGIPYKFSRYEMKTKCRKINFNEQ
jgi:hypothetical protein